MSAMFMLCHFSTSMSLENLKQSYSALDSSAPRSGYTARRTHHSVLETDATGTQAKDIDVYRRGQSNIIEAIDARTIYGTTSFQNQGLKEILENILHLEHRKTDLVDWRAFVDNIVSPQKEVHIAIVGKYAELEDAYMSVREALVHAGAKYATKVRRHWINAEDIETDPTLLQKLRENESSTVSLSLEASDLVA